MDNRMFNRGDNWTAQVAGMLPIEVWKQTQAARGDSNGNAIEESLTAIMTRVYDRALPSHPLLELISFDTSPAEGVVATKYVEGETRAKFGPMGSRSIDMNTADLKKQPVTIPTQRYFSAYEVWLAEAQALALSDDNAIPRMAASITAAYRDLMVLHFLCGDPDAGIPGVLNTDKIVNSRRYSNTDRITPATTPIDMSELLIDLAHSIADQSEDIYGTEGGYALALPAKLYRLIQRTHFDTARGESVLSRVESDSGFTVIPVNRLNAIDADLLDSGTGNISAAFAGKLTPQTHAKMLPQPLTQLSPFVDNAGLRTIVPSICNIGGLHLYEPLAFATALNIYSDS